MLPHSLILLLAVLNYVLALDPPADFCRLHSHRTAVVDRKFYIDGGFVNWTPLAAGSVNETSTWLRVGDFDTPHLGFPSQTTLAKKEIVPSVSGGILWPDAANKIIYAYGGEQEDEETPDERLWLYDIVYNTWNVSQAEEIIGVGQAAWGAGATAPDKALGYYYGGRPTNATDARIFSTMVVYDMLNNKFTTQSGPDHVDLHRFSSQYPSARTKGFSHHPAVFLVAPSSRNFLPRTMFLLWLTSTESIPS